MAHRPALAGAATLCLLLAFTPTGLADYSLARETNTAAACREYLEPISGLVFDCDPLLGFHPTGEIASLGPRFASALLYERDDPMPATGVVCEGQICIDGQAGIVGEHCVEFVVDIEFYDTAGTHTSSSGSAAGPFCGDLRPLVYVWMVEEWYFNAEHCHAMFTSLTKVDGQQLGPSHTIDRNTC